MKPDPITVPFRFGKHLVPGVWRYLLPEAVLEMRLPGEERSTCARCPLIVTDDFHPDYKCCTYHPRIPNFLLGLALDDPGAGELVARFVARGFTTPEGSEHTPLAWIDSLAQRATDSYGKTTDVACSFLDTATGRCQVYAFRNSVCSTFFCQHDHGERGEHFWDQLQSLVGQIETALAQWALEEVGFDVPAYFARFDALAPRVADVSDPATRAWSRMAQEALWGEWLGREAELFRLTATAIKDNRDRLYAIAVDQKILKPQAFESASAHHVPREYHNQLTLTDFEGGHPALITDLEYLTKLSHRNLWMIPSGGESVTLSPQATLSANDQSDAVGCHYRLKPFRVRLASGAASVEVYLDESECRALELFQGTRRVIDDETFAALSEVGISDPRAFIAAWMGQGILVA